MTITFELKLYEHIYLFTYLLFTFLNFISYVLFCSQHLNEHCARSKDTLAAANSMGGVNSIPVVSQAKSGVQLICGDTDGAAETQKDFLQQCPVVSQVCIT